MARSAQSYDWIRSMSQFTSLARSSACLVPTPRTAPPTCVMSYAEKAGFERVPENPVILRLAD
jgi:hypothetical protein